MELSAAASWLNSTFAGIDHALLQALHDLALWGGEVLTPFLTFISLLGENGYLSLALGVILLVFRKTRKIGFCVLFAVVIGALLTNGILKNLIARPRLFDTSPEYFAWWEFVGSVPESSHSFPSGHVTAATASMVALIIASKKRVAWFGLLYIVLMALSRMYLMVHYFTDVFGALIVGTLAAFCACWLANKFFDYAKKKPLVKINRFFAEEV